MRSTLTYEELLDNPAVKEVTPEELRVGMQIIGNRSVLGDAGDDSDLGKLIANGLLRIDSIDQLEVDRSLGRAKVGARVSAFTGGGMIELHLPYDAPVLVWLPRPTHQPRQLTNLPSRDSAKPEVLPRRSRPSPAVLKTAIIRRLLDR
jgi:hypothetical protein